jgi:hypothetical protein
MHTDGPDAESRPASLDPLRENSEHDGIQKADWKIITRDIR